MQLYIYDFSTIRPFDVDDSGIYPYRYFEDYFTDSARDAYFIEQDAKLVGFAMTRESESGLREVSEFFVMRRHRRTGIGVEAARLLFQRHPGSWLLHFDDANAEAENFWPRAVRAYGRDVVTEKLSQMEFPKTEFRFTVDAEKPESQISN